MKRLLALGVLGALLLGYGVAAVIAWAQMQPPPLLTHRVTWYVVSTYWDPLALDTSHWFCTKADADAVARQARAEAPHDTWSDYTFVFESPRKVWRIGGASQSFSPQFDGLHCVKGATT